MLIAAKHRMLHKKCHFIIFFRFPECSVCLIIIFLFYIRKTADAKQCRQKHRIFLINIPHKADC